MHFFRSIRVLVAAGCVVAWLGVAYTAEKSASSMADAATKFLSSLTPEQRQKAAFAFDGGRAPQMALHPDGDVSAQRADGRRR